MRIFSYMFLSCFMLSSCAGGPKIAVDPQSITDGEKYQKDLEECRIVSKNYDSTGSVAGSAAVGALAGVGTIAAIIATGGLYLLPAGAALAGGTGAGIGGGISKNKESRAQEKIWANCMNTRGYKAYSSN